MPEAPYYESRYIRANHPERPQALWLRETLLLPTAGDPVADVWVMVFDPDGEGNKALKEPYPIDAAAYGYDNWTARIGATSIDDRSAQGVVTGGNRSARWDLRITPGSEHEVRLLTDRAYKRASRRPRQLSATRWRSSTGRWNSTTHGSCSTAGPAV